MITEKITGIMLTKNDVRHSFVRMSIESFYGQTYPNKELLIVNSGSVPIGEDDPRVAEIIVQPRTIGALRNIGLDYVKEGYAITWDDDDWRHPNYLKALAMAASCKYEAAMEYMCWGHKSMLHVDAKTGETRCEVFEGFHTPVLFNIATLKHRYEDLNRGEDCGFKNRFKRVEEAIMPPNYYVRFWHGDNTCPRKHIMEKGYETNEWETLIKYLIETYKLTS